MIQRFREIGTEGNTTNPSSPINVALIMWAIGKFGYDPLRVSEWAQVDRFHTQEVLDRLIGHVDWKIAHERWTDAKMFCLDLMVALGNLLTDDGVAYRSSTDLGDPPVDAM